jgi:hypothetical protein
MTEEELTETVRALRAFTIEKNVAGETTWHPGCCLLGADAIEQLLAERDADEEVIRQFRRENEKLLTINALMRGQIATARAIAGEDWKQ